MSRKYTKNEVVDNIATYFLTILHEFLTERSK